MTTKIMKWIALATVIAIGIVIVAKLRGCDDDHEVVTIITPKDSNFVPIAEKHFQPPSFPFSGKKFPVKLPSNVNEKDVARIITVETKIGNIDLIETKNGELFVAKDSSIESVSVTTIDPQLLSFQMGLGVGLSIGRHGENARLSPTVVFAPLRWSGWLDIPTAIIDLDGIGIGIQAQAYHEIYIGVAYLKRYEEGTELKLSACYMF